MTGTIRIIIADDHTVVRQGLRIMLEPKPEYRLIGDARNGKELLELVANQQPDLIILDLLMPLMDGAEAIRIIRSQFPDIKILVLTSYSEESMVMKTMRSGANGYILKETSPEELIQAINAVMRGEMWIYPNLMTDLLASLIHPENRASELDILTKRERQVVALVARGLSNPDIAASQGINESTVRFHLSNIYSKLGLQNRTQVALYALRTGLADLDQPD